MKLTGRVTRVESGTIFADKKQRVTIELYLPDAKVSCGNIHVPNTEGVGVDESVTAEISYDFVPPFVS